jgi:hypothetical protein
VSNSSAHVTHSFAKDKIQKLDLEEGEVLEGEKREEKDGGWH